MACRTVYLSDGTTAIVCGVRRPEPKQRRCVVCNVSDTMATMRLCDGRIPGRKGTCDAPICVEHAQHIEPDTDFCPRCVRALQEREAS